MTSRYVELHCHSHYSLLDGASSPAAQAEQAAALGYGALALTDHDALYGAVEFAEAAKRVGIRPIFGTELTLHDDTHLTLLAENANGWRNLCQLITAAQSNAPKGHARLPAGVLERHTGGVIALSGCRHGRLSKAVQAGDRDAALATGRWLREIFGRNNLYIELSHHHLPDDEWRNRQLTSIARYLDLPIVATNNVHYATLGDKPLQDVLVCIRHNMMIEESERLRRPNREFYLKSADEMIRHFANCPEAIANTITIAERCTFDLQFGLQMLPEFPTPQRTPPAVYLRDLCEEALRDRPDDADYRDQVRYELGVIERAGYADYFLITWEIMQWARARGIRCQGRGSAANSLIAYLLGISPVNPREHNLVFERFLSDDRHAVPDIDVDFDNKRREEVIQHVYERYGRAHAAMTCTFSTFRSRSAVRDLAKVLSVTSQQVNDALFVLEQQEAAQAYGAKQQPNGATPAPDVALLVDLVHRLKGIPRHVGQHNGGMVLMCRPLADCIPVEPATMENRSVIQWDKDSLEAAGIAKFDILGLGMLAALTEAEERMKEEGRRQNGSFIHPSAFILPTSFGDPAVYEMARDADTLGVFQLESRAQAQVLPKLKPVCFNDLIVSISLIRPGPLQGGMVHPFLRRRNGEEPVTFAHPLLEDALAETAGVIVFQEQVLKVARDLAGFSAGQGELLRRALGKKDAYAAIEAFRERFVQGARGRGVAVETAEAVFGQLKAFGGYSFAKAHAASFAVLVYQSAWLRQYHPAAFYCVLLNCQPMGFWSPATLLGDARRRGIPTLPVSISHSEDVCKLVHADAKTGVRLGFNYVKGMSDVAAEQLQAERDSKPFVSLHDLARRTKFSKRLLQNLIASGALDVWGARRELLWQLGKIDLRTETLHLEDVESITLPTLSDVGAQQMEVRATGLSTGEHVMGRLRPKLPPDILTSKQLSTCQPKERVRTAGLIIVRQAPPTAKGMRFFTAEDELGLANWVIRPNVYTRYRAIANHPLLIAEGIIEHDGQTNLLVTQLEILS